MTPEENKPTFEQALAELEKIVTEIESGEIPLEKSIEKYAEGIGYIKQCRKILSQAEKKIQLLSAGEDDELDLAGELPDPDRPGGEQTDADEADAEGQQAD
jgi:exodeoxyribonuclease VII small subunit